MSENNPETRAVEFALQAVLKSAKFSAAPQMSAFLRYVVRETLAGNAARIKAYTVAVDALGKPTAFDPQNDPSVRVLAKRLRASLENYHQQHPELPLRIEMKAGSYVPKFVSAESAESGVVNDSRLSSTTRARALPSEDSDVVRTSSDEPDEVLPLAATPGSVHNVTGPRLALPLAALLLVGTIGLIGTDFGEPGTPTMPPIATASTVVVPASIDAVANTPNELHAAGAQAALQQTNTDRRDDADAGAVRVIGSSSSLSSGASRPETPRVLVEVGAGDGSITQRVADVFGGVLSRFDDVDVLRIDTVGNDIEFWPEDYRLQQFTTLRDDHRQLTMQLMHAESGRVVSSRSLTLDQAELGGSDIPMIEKYAAELAQAHGPILQDYETESSPTPTMQCVFALRDARSPVANPTTIALARTLENCIDTLADAVSRKARSLQFQIRAHLVITQLDGEDDRSAALDQAVGLSQQAVQLTPYSARTQLALMSALHLAGEARQAARHGAFSASLNRLDNTILRGRSDLRSG